MKLISLIALCLAGPSLAKAEITFSNSGGTVNSVDQLVVWTDLHGPANTTLSVYVQISVDGEIWANLASGCVTTDANGNASPILFNTIQHNNYGWMVCIHANCLGDGGQSSEFWVADD